MKLIRFSSKIKLAGPNAVAIGNFDGMHLGHQKLISKLTQDSKALGLNSVLCTFEPLSWQFFGNKGHRLSNLRTKIYLAESMGVDNFLVVNFTRQFSRLSHTDFIRDFLAGQLNAAHVITGEDFRFGADRKGNVHQLEQAELAGLFSYGALDSYPANSTKIGSSFIRELMEADKLKQANELLGYPYTLIARVTKGNNMGGTSLATPTANLNLKGFIPPLKGVYMCGVFLGNEDKYKPSLANLGVRPTLDGKKFGIEVHILDFSQKIYGATIKLEFIRKLREEKKFASLEELKTQLAKDKDEARKFFSGLAKSC